MDLLQKNPFTTLKANDLDDGDINEQWVDLEGDGLVDLFSPSHYLSQYLVGGKGSGKTHLMRYFSYKSQALRNNKNALKGISQDGYFGVYFQASGLNGSRFDNLPYDINLKSALFEYSFELWCAALVMESISYLYSKDDQLLNCPNDFCNDVLSLIGGERKHSLNKNLTEVKNWLINTSKAVDSEINNAFFKEKLDIEILVSRGDLVFGIPKLLQKHSPYFKNVSFLYLIDEMENISEIQQRYINSLLREKKLPVSFRLGFRTHGIKTFETLGSGEENREGHEFETIRLDNIYNESRKYEDFAFNLIFNRLLRAGFIVNNDFDSLDKKKFFLREMFENPNIEKNINLSKSKKAGISAVLKAFNSRIATKVPKNIAVSISRNLSYPSNRLVELAAVHIFSQEWSKKKRSINELIEISEKIKYEISMLSNLEGESIIAKKIKYYKNNYVASSLRASVGNNLDEYLGIDNLLAMTKGFPRHILTLLRNVYKIEVFQGKMPFSPDDKISLRAQKIALKESSDWLHDDCVTEGALGSSVAVALSRLCEILRIEMYSDKPVECSASGFIIDRNSISEKAKEILDWATLVRVLIKSDSPRQEKNSQKIVSNYYVNGLLCPKWGLSVRRRGSLAITAENFNKIFDPDLEEEFSEYRREFYNSRYLPFEIVSDVCAVDEKNSKQLGLEF
ncbi:hypothetical protein LG409_14245 [Halomonas sp. NyZ770]|uniref:ORC-CDC6 family AAA ATPase n=1 Tax=Halomonas sp. NyZ770 TaxID=2883106 RepID=UPI001D09DCBC|nr:hypothetical protein [Halomonas sp. NyZ770]UDM06528.1 hypothetical protein LG409_14245 [Halomonas sp. NyZ770]